MTYYKNWEISYRSVIAIGGKAKTYTHYCPLDDFFTIAGAIQRRFKKQNLVTALDIRNDLHGKRLTRGRVFDKRTHEYKIDITFFVLVENGFLKKAGRAKYAMLKDGEELRKWMEKLK